MRTPKTKCLFNCNSEVQMPSVNVSTDDLFHLGGYVTKGYCVITVFCLFFNAILVAVTIKTPQLRSICNVLIAIQAVADFIFNSCSISSTYIITRGELITDRECYFTNFVFFYAMNWTTLLMFWIGLDRLLSVKYAAWYLKLGFNSYLTFILGSCLLYSNLIMVLGYFTLEDELQFCTLSFSFNGLARNVWNACQSGLNVAGIIVYSILKREIKKQVFNSEATKQMIKSVYTITVLYMLGWGTLMVAISVAKVLVER
ncbi:hypothetical protein L596_024655 [Steinernema carpocapsae]|uniref:G-protein coupled receptors family 1 profile domain-containing protein n=1 Tax=Steinernema carpocapsae TaxID=34508 RepID=A0A4U5M5C9_STECR|nr:hypothetical protein L596_024655 [Steinernema carpocapsae]